MIAEPAAVEPPRGRWWLWIAALAAAALVMTQLPVLDGVTWLVEAVRDLGPVGQLLYGAAYVVATVIGVPATFLTLGAGLAWGPLIGLAVVWPSATVGALAAFALARTLVRQAVTARVKASPMASAVDGALGEGGFSLVLLLRLSPAFPFNLTNYALGVSAVSARDYALATTIGILPGCALYTWIGSTLGSVADLAAGRGTSTPGTLPLQIVGLLATIAVTILITRRARAALQARLHEQEGSP